MASLIDSTLAFHDMVTGPHQNRVQRLVDGIAADMGLEEEDRQGVRAAASFHDIGKLVIPARILNKNGRLTAAEYTTVKKHADAGFQILRGVNFPWPVADMVHQHHERMDGSGYPQGLKADAIPIPSRIVAVADVADAIMSHRTYDEARSPEIAMNELRKDMGTLYDSDVVNSCVKLLDDGSDWTH